MSRTKQSLDSEAKFLAIVAEKGGRVLTQYVSARDKVTIVCANGHIFDMSPGHVSSDGTWCRKCPRGATLTLLTGFQDRVNEMKGVIIGSSTNATDQTTIQCELGHQWMASPSSIYKTGTWCPQCDTVRGVSYEDKVRAAIRYRGGELINTYRNDNKGKLQIRCEQGHIFENKPSGILTGNWCQSCSGRSTAKERFEKIVQEKNGKITTPYVNTGVPVGLICSSGHPWNTYPTHILAGTWCPKCPKSSTIAAEKRFRTEVQRREGTLLTPYQGIHTHVTVRCNNNHEFKAEPNSIMSMNSWCPRCSDCSSEQAAENFYARVEQLKGKVHEEYVYAYGPVEVECEFGHKWDTIPHNVMANGNWCPVCRESHGERLLRHLLQKHNVQFQAEKVHPLLPKYFYDFYFVHNGKEFYIEYDGGQHFQRVKFYCSTEEDYQYRREIDVIKTRTVIETGGYIVRLDHTLSDEEVEIHLLQAVNGNERFYVSNEAMYYWIFDGIEESVPITQTNPIPPKMVTLNVTPRVPPNVPSNLPTNLVLTPIVPVAPMKTLILKPVPNPINITLNLKVPDPAPPINLTLNVTN